MEALIHLFRNWGMTTWLLSLPMCGPVWTGPACCLHCPATCRWQAWGQSLLIVTILIYLVAKLLLGVPPPMPVHILLLSDKSTEWTEHFRKGGGGVHRHGDRDDYACFGGRAPMPRLEGMESSIREPSYKECVALWLRPVMLVSKHRCALGNSVVVVLAQHQNAPES
jgi:hypothetical protein